MMTDMVFNIFGVENSVENATKYATSMNAICMPPILYADLVHKSMIAGKLVYRSDEIPTVLSDSLGAFEILLVNCGECVKDDNGKIQIRIKYSKSNSNLVLPEDELEHLAYVLDYRIGGLCSYILSSTDKLRMIPVHCTMYSLDGSGEFKEKIIWLNIQYKDFDPIVDLAEDWDILFDCYVKGDYVASDEQVKKMYPLTCE